MKIVNSISDYRNARDSLSGTVALVPTMGNLHEGHLSLVSEARDLADHVVVTIFVNPMQFGANEDLDSYPRTLAEDIKQLEALAVDILFTPDTDVMYPEGVELHTQVSVPELTRHYCGKNRPGHFTGVATIVLKLFNLTQPDIAVFGKKDYQQLAVIRKLTHDMGLRTRIIGKDTIRESNGLAMSSRNQYLSSQEKQTAANLKLQLDKVKAEIMSGNKDFSSLSGSAINDLKSVGFDMDYFEVADQNTLKPAIETTSEFVILTAGRLGKTRLIDNSDFKINQH